MADREVPTLPWDRAYFAGMFEGKGRTRIYLPGKGGPYASIELTHHDVPILQWLQSMFGGLVVDVQRRRAWRLYGRDIRPFLEMIQPYVRLRRREFAIVIEICGLLGTDAHRKYPPGALRARNRLMEEHRALLARARARRVAVLPVRSRPRALDAARGRNADVDRLLA